jgi:IS5 family transposase
VRQRWHPDERVGARASAVVDHPFLVVKRSWGHAKVRYCRLATNLAQMHMLFVLANVYRVRRRLLRT